MSLDLRSSENGNRIIVIELSRIPAHSMSKDNREPIHDLQLRSSLSCLGAEETFAKWFQSGGMSLANSIKIVPGSKIIHNRDQQAAALFKFLKSMDFIDIKIVTIAELCLKDCSVIENLEYMEAR